MPHPSITAETYPHKPAIIMGDSGEMVTYRQLDERSNQGAHLFRLVYAGVCVLLNLFLQLAVLKWVNQYIVGNSVWTIQGQYAQFHREIFNQDGLAKSWVKCYKKNYHMITILTC